MERGLALLESARREGFANPPPRKVDCPIADMHTHFAVRPSRSPRRRAGRTARRMPASDANAQLVAAGRLYGIARFVAIADLATELRARDRFPEVQIAVPIRWTHWGRPGRFVSDNLRTLHAAHAQGVRIVKMWMAPRLADRVEGEVPRPDAPALDPIFEFIERHDMAVLIHVSDPDRWFATKYAGRARLGKKADQYPPLEARMARHRSVLFQAAHMAGDPEHLDHVHRLLCDHPNLVVDTSATKWMVRELGRQPEHTRAFFDRWADRIVFGTDQVVLHDPEPHRYTVRYWIHRVFWETDLVCPLPIEDADSQGPPVLRGVDLSPRALERIYWRTPLRLLPPDRPPAE
ncbi:MAG: amidohydrolase family protein [Armatimonadota bacterium]|nr:amidohydrolase family protein [Armatimonadota bacterium]MDR5696257.1 amidohydrolase family protein [Armatimonadota bacterium]